MQELGPNQEKALAALESGEYEQGTNFLCKDGKYCCLGVFSELFATETFYYHDSGRRQYKCDSHNTYNTAPPSVVEAMSLRNEGGGHVNDSRSDLWILNDVNKLSFKQIAAIIRSNPSAYLKEPK